MEHQTEKNKESEILNTNESLKMIKKLKKKEKKNYKDLKDLLDNIRDEEKEIKKSHLKKKIIKKDNIIKKQITENKNEININKEIEKEIEDLSNSNNNCNIQSDNSKRNSTTNSSSISQEEIINDIHYIGNKPEIKKINNDSPKFKRSNYILKQREIINDIDKDIILNNEFTNSKNIWPMCKYYEGSEKTLQKINDTTIDINNSINFIEKNSLSSNFNFNNNRFIKKNNLKDNKEENYINLINNQNNLIFNNSINLNHINYNYNNKNYNNGFFNNFNINLFYNNSYMNKEIGNNLFEEKEKDIFDNKIINKNEKYEGNIEPNKNYNIFFNINNYILQNVLTPEKNNSNIIDNQKEYISPLINNYNLNQNHLNNLPNLYSLILNNTNNSNIFNNDIKNFNNNINNNPDNNNINNNIINNNSNYINTEYYQNKNYYIKITKNKKNIFSRRPNDWICSKCYNLNFGFRVFCNRCSEPKGQSNSNNNDNL